MIKRIIAIFIIFTFGLVLFSIYQTRKIEKEIGKLTPPLMKEKRKVRQQPPSLIPSRPEDYGMIVTDDNSKPRTQEEWDSLFSQKINELKSQFDFQTWDKVIAQIKEEPQKTEEKIIKIDSNIQKCKEILDKDPNNQEIQEKLERLMMLKSIAKELPKNK